jgi:hypothetical protein
MKDVAERFGNSRNEPLPLLPGQARSGHGDLVVAFDEIAATRAGVLRFAIRGTALCRLDCFLRCDMAAPEFTD